MFLLFLVFYKLMFLTAYFNINFYIYSLIAIWLLFQNFYLITCLTMVVIFSMLNKCSLILHLKRRDLLITWLNLLYLYPWFLHRLIYQYLYTSLFLFRIIGALIINGDIQTENKIGVRDIRYPLSINWCKIKLEMIVKFAFL